MILFKILYFCHHFLYVTHLRILHRCTFLSSLKLYFTKSMRGISKIEFYLDSIIPFLYDSIVQYIQR